MFRTGPIVSWVLLCIYFVALPAPVAAQDEGSQGDAESESGVRPVPLGDFSSLRYVPAVSTASYLGVEGARIEGHLNLAVGLSADYAHRPLVIYGAECDSTGRRCETDGARSDLVSMTGAVFAYGALTLFDSFEASLMLPMVYSRGESFLGEPDLQGRRVTLVGGSSLGPGDLQVGGKYRITDVGPMAMALSLFATGPTAQFGLEGRYAGSSSLTVGGGLASEFVQDRFRLAANIGAIYRPRALFLSTRVGTQLSYGLAGGYDLTSLMTLFGELQGASTFTQELDENPLEARMAFRVRVDEMFLTAGASTGVIAGVGMPVFRLTIDARFVRIVRDGDGDGVLDALDACPAEPEDLDGYLDEDGCPDSDNDGDGVPDASDQCVNEQEDRDGFQDEDGCPDEDNDGDQIADGYDSCPMVPEDVDGDLDDDGCPDKDRDRDGIDDDVDQCPDQPEDTDGFGDEDGCPDVDFDQDGIPDDEDQCPDQPESMDGVEDEDGCPEEEMSFEIEETGND